MDELDRKLDVRKIMSLEFNWRMFIAYSLFVDG